MKSAGWSTHKPRKTHKNRTGKTLLILSGYLFPKNKPIEEKKEQEKPFKLSDLITFSSTEESTK